MSVFDSSKITVVKAAVAFVDAAGNPARVDGVPTWETSDPAVAQMMPADDGLSAMFSFAGLGKTTVTVRADADLGEGVRELILQGELEFVPGEAVAGNIVFSDATA
jgi:hypothetical protein